MRGGHYQRVVVLVFVWIYLSFCSTRTIAAVVPVYNGKMNAAVGSVMQSKVGKWGFAANDPRVAATANGIGSGLTTVAVGVATGAVATVGWPALLVGAGIAAVVGGAVSLAQDAVSKWLFNADGTVTASATAQPAPSQKGPDTYSYQGAYFKGGSAQAVAAAYTQDLNAQNPGANYPKFFVQTCFIYNSFDTCTVGFTQNGNTTLNWLTITVSRQVGVPYTCDGATVNGLCQPPATNATAPLTSSLTAAVANLSSVEAAKPVSDELLAAAVNASWKAADNSQGGLPWSASDPVTPGDVAAWRAGNPSMVPTVGDALAPVTNGVVVSVTPSVSGQPSPGTTPTPGSGTKVDLGPDPNISAPILEPTPTASQVLSPLLNLMPDLKSFTVPAHGAVCPTSSFVALGKTYTLDSHCALLESNRALIEAAMLLCWTLASVFIVLRA